VRKNAREWSEAGRKGRKRRGKRERKNPDDAVGQSNGGRQRGEVSEPGKPPKGKERDHCGSKGTEKKKGGLGEGGG